MRINLIIVRDANTIMLKVVIIDHGSLEEYEPTKQENDIYSAMYLVADSVMEGYVEIDRHPRLKIALYGSRPDMPYHYSHFPSLGLSPDDTIFSSNPEVRELALKQSGLIAQNAILILASAGLSFVLPKLFFRTIHMDEIESIKEKLSAERNDYLYAVAKLADQAFDRLMAGVYKDTVSWAMNEARFKLVPPADELDKRLEQLDSSLLRRLGVDFFRDGVPAITGAFLDKGAAQAGRKSIEEILKVLCSELSKNVEARRMPEANYGVQIVREFRKRSNK